jgi:hypothetical protein
MLKVPPHPDYPPEDGRYLRGNDFSPVAVVIILNTEAENIPPWIEQLVRAGFRRMSDEIIQWIDKSFTNRLYHD